MPPGSKKRKSAKKKKEMEEQQQQQQQQRHEEEEVMDMETRTQPASSKGNGCHNGNSIGDSINFANDTAIGHLMPHHVVGKDSEVGPLPPPPPPPQNDLNQHHLHPRSNQDEEGELQSQSQNKKMEANGPGEVAAAEKVVVEDAPVVEAEDKPEALKVSGEAEDQKEAAAEKPVIEGESIDVPAEQVVLSVEEVGEKADVVEMDKELPAEVVENAKQEGIEEILAEVVEEVQAEVAEEATADSVQAEVAEVATAESKDVLAEVAEEALVAEVVPPPSQDREVKVVPLDVADDEDVENPGEISRANHAVATAATSVTTEVAHQSPLVKRTTWWNCCGLFDVFVGSDR